MLGLSIGHLISALRTLEGSEEAWEGLTAIKKKGVSTLTAVNRTREMAIRVMIASVAFVLALTASACGELTDEPAATMSGTETSAVIPESSVGQGTPLATRTAEPSLTVAPPATTAVPVEKTSAVAAGRADCDATWFAVANESYSVCYPPAANVVAFDLQGLPALNIHDPSDDGSGFLVAISLSDSRSISAGAGCDGVSIIPGAETFSSATIQSGFGEGEACESTGRIDGRPYRAILGDVAFETGYVNIVANFTPDDTQTRENVQELLNSLRPE